MPSEARRIRKTALLFHFSLSSRNRSSTRVFKNVTATPELFISNASWLVGVQKIFLGLSSLIENNLPDCYFIQSMAASSTGRVGDRGAVGKFREILIVQVVTHMVPRDK